jgi:hypothetical protein
MAEDGGSSDADEESESADPDLFPGAFLINGMYVRPEPQPRIGFLPPRRQLYPLDSRREHPPRIQPDSEPKLQPYLPLHFPLFPSKTS